VIPDTVAVSRQRGEVYLQLEVLSRGFRRKVENNSVRMEKMGIIGFMGLMGRIVVELGTGAFHSTP